MTLQDLVCTPEQSRKFSELGLFGDSVFVRYQFKGNSKPFISQPFGPKEEAGVAYIGPAPTAQELAEWVRLWMAEDVGNRKQAGGIILTRYLLSLGRYGMAELMATAILQIIKEQ